MAPPALALRSLCVRCLTTSSTFGAFGRRAPVLPLRLMHGSFPGTSSDRLRPIPTKVRLNRLQGHRLKGRFWWFIGVYSHSSERGKDAHSAEGAEGFRAAGRKRPTEALLARGLGRGPRRGFSVELAVGVAY